MTADNRPAPRPDDGSGEAAPHAPLFDSAQLSQCVQCGFCLSSCPTYEVSHLEEHGPRGRILGMRLVQDGEISLDHPDVVDSLVTCVQCRACEEVCPSLVEFGPLMETARAQLLQVTPPKGRRRLAHELGYRALGRRGILRAGALGLAAAQATRADRLLPDRMRVRRRVRPSQVLRRLRDHRDADGPPALVFRGCVMDQLFADVHQDTIGVLEAIGYAPTTEPAPPCCGALHVHAGRDREARRLAGDVVDAYHDTTGPIVVDSGGCGAAMKEYGHLLGTARAKAVAARVVDLSEIVTADDLAGARPVPARMAFQAPCHVKNVQRLGSRPLELLRAIPDLELVEPDDWHLCCGSGGAYSLEHPEFAEQLLTRKADAIARTGATEVVSGNPGCALQLARAGLTVWHPAQLLARALVPGRA